MKRYQSSVTAQGIALIRAVESRKPEAERVCYDPNAQRFLNPLLSALSGFVAWYGGKISPGTGEYLIARTRYIDDFVQTCLARGLQQLVILGAGFDSRAYRFEGLKHAIKVFEVDHPATQQVKLSKLRRIFGAIPAYVTYVPIDFVSQSLNELRDHGYDGALKTLFIWEGVTYYISAEAVDSTLAFVAHHSARSSWIIFDYVYVEDLTARDKRPEISRMQRYSRFTDEGLDFGIKAGTIDEFLEARGFTQVQKIGRAHV